MSEAVTGAYVAGCFLLLVAGGAKVHRPGAARRALAGAGLRVPRWTVPLAGIAELAVGAIALVVGGTVGPVAVACSYAAFAVFVVVLLRRSPGAGCGCFGETAAPIGPVHLVVDAGIAVAALLVARNGGLPVTAPPARAALAVLGAALAWMTYLALVPLPRLLQAVRESRQ